MPSPPHEKPPIFEPAASAAACENGVAKIAARLPEVTDNYPRILQSALAITREYQLKPPFFEHDDLAFTLCALARYHSSGAEEAGRYEAPGTFIANSLLLLECSEDESQYLYGRRPETSGAGWDMQTLHSLTLPQLTAHVKERVKQTNFLKNPRQKLGITAETEKPYDILVLDYLDTGEEERIDLEGTDSEKQLRLKSIHNRRLLNLEDGGVFVIQEPVSRKPIMCLNRTVAAGLMQQPGVDIDMIGLGARISFRHEWVHTQKVLGVGYYGKALDERLADFVGGGRPNYPELRCFFDGLRAITRVDILKEAVQFPGDASPTDFACQIAKQIGLLTTHELQLATPNNHFTSQIVNETTAMLGGLDGILRRAYAEHSPEHNEEFASRLEDLVYDTVATPGIVSSLYQLKLESLRRLGQPFLAELAEQLL